jgi:copper(I)-binding protein
MKRINWALLLLSLLLAACASPTSSQTTSGSLEIKDAWARPAVKMEMGDDNGGEMGGGGMSGSNSAAYMTIVNNGAITDRLTSAESDVADSVELHQTVMKDDVMSMSPVEAIEVPANGQVELKPGSYHIMLIGLKQDLKVGDMVKLTLSFEKAGKIIVEAEVKNP